MLFEPVSLSQRLFQSIFQLQHLWSPGLKHVLEFTVHFSCCIQLCVQLLQLKAKKKTRRKPFMMSYLIDPAKWRAHFSCFPVEKRHSSAKFTPTMCCWTVFVWREAFIYLHFLFLLHFFQLFQQFENLLFVLLSLQPAHFSLFFTSLYISPQLLCFLVRLFFQTVKL